MNAFSGLIIGALLGLIGSFSYMNMNLKKSQRPTMSQFIIPIFTIAGALIGANVGVKIKRHTDIVTSLGLDKITYNHFKVGRFWQTISTFRDIDGGVHKIHTFKNGDYVITHYNGEMVLQHPPSASSVNITKYHNDAIRRISTYLKDKYGDIYLEKLRNKRNNPI